MGNGPSVACQIASFGCPSNITQNEVISNNFQNIIKNNVSNSCNISTTATTKNIDVIIENSDINGAIKFGSIALSTGAGCLMKTIINNAVSVNLLTQQNQAASISPSIFSFSGPANIDSNQQLSTNIKNTIVNIVKNTCSMDTSTSLSNVFLDIVNSKTNAPQSYLSNATNSGTCRLTTGVTSSIAETVTEKQGQSDTITGWMAQILDAIDKAIKYFAVASVAIVIFAFIIFILKGRGTRALRYDSQTITDTSASTPVKSSNRIFKNI